MLRSIEGKDSNEYAMVLSLHRDDIINCGISAEVAAKIDDDLLSEIAERLGDVLLKIGYWEVLKTLVTECVEMPDDEEKEEVFPANAKHKEVVIDENEDFSDEKYEREGGGNDDDE